MATFPKDNYSLRQLPTLAIEYLFHIRAPAALPPIGISSTYVVRSRQILQFKYILAIQGVTFGTAYLSILPYQLSFSRSYPSYQLHHPSSLVFRHNPSYESFGKRPAVPALVTVYACLGIKGTHTIHCFVKTATVCQPLHHTVWLLPTSFPMPT